MQVFVFSSWPLSSWFLILLCIILGTIQSTHMHPSQTACLRMFYFHLVLFLSIQTLHAARIVRHTFRNSQVIKLQHIVLCFHHLFIFFFFRLVFGAIERIDYRSNHCYEWILWYIFVMKSIPIRNDIWTKKKKTKYVSFMLCAHRVIHGPVCDTINTHAHVKYCMCVI